MSCFPKPESSVFQGADFQGSMSDVKGVTDNYIFLHWVPVVLKSVMRDGS